MLNYERLRGGGTFLSAQVTTKVIEHSNAVGIVESETKWPSSRLDLTFFGDIGTQERDNLNLDHLTKILIR